MADASPKFVSLGDGNEVLQVALAAGDSILANERAFVYRGLGLASEVQAVGAVGRAIGWYVGARVRKPRRCVVGTNCCFLV